jgi:hypothetical protein
MLLNEWVVMKNKSKNRRENFDTTEDKLINNRKYATGIS